MWRGYILVALAGTASAYVATDEVMVLPGWSGKLPSRMFSGYLDATPQGETVYKLHMHYTFWESEGDPAKDPLLIWSNGGPGAGSETPSLQSLDGHFTAAACLVLLLFCCFGDAELFLHLRF
jgi:carboxypeptidase C (cathepsin A)